MRPLFSPLVLVRDRLTDLEIDAILLLELACDSALPNNKTIPFTNTTRYKFVNTVTDALSNIIIDTFARNASSLFFNAATG